MILPDCKTSIFIKLLCFVIAIISIIAFRIHIINGPNSAERDLFNPKLTRMRKYCNFLDDIKIVDENSFPHEKFDLTLAKLIVMIRHGDRGPLNNVRNIQNISCNATHIYDMNRDLDEESLNLTEKLSDLQSKITNYDSNLKYSYSSGDGCKAGELTKFGTAQHLKLGLILGRIYLPKLNLDSGNLCKLIKINFTHYSRTFHSALSFLYGFFNQNPFELLPCFSQFSNIYFCDFDKSRQHCFDDCLSKSQLQSKAYGIFDYRQERQNFVTKIDEIKQIMAPVGSNVLYNSIVSVFDGINTYFCHKEKLPCDDDANCVEADDVHQVFSYLVDKGHRLIASEDFQRLSWSNIYGFLQTLIQIIETESMEKFFLFSAHDLTIQALATSLGFCDGHIPPYASRVIFEVYENHSNHSNDDDQYIRILYNGEDVTKQLLVCHQSNESCVNFDSFQLIRQSAFKNFVQNTFSNYFSSDPCYNK